MLGIVCRPGGHAHPRAAVQLHGHRHRRAPHALAAGGGALYLYVYMCALCERRVCGQRYTFPTESGFSCPHRAEDVYSQCVRTTLNHGTTTGNRYLYMYIRI